MKDHIAPTNQPSPQHTMKAMRTTKPVLTKPDTYADGACKACIARAGNCAYHIQENARQEVERTAILRRVCASYKAAEIARVCAANELESDEFYTREEKAVQFFGALA